MSKGEREITSKLNHIYRGREYSREERVIIKDPRCLVFKRREVTCLQEGKDMFIFVCISSVFLIPYLLPVSHDRFRGSKTSKGRKSLHSLHIFTFGDMSISNRVLSTYSLHVIPVLVLLWFLLFALASRCTCVI